MESGIISRLEGSNYVSAYKNRAQSKLSVALHTSPGRLSQEAHKFKSQLGLNFETQSKKKKRLHLFLPCICTSVPELWLWKTKFEH
jgi:hypothetical protein